MKALILDKPYSFQHSDFADPKVVSDTAIVAIKRVGICGTDYHAFKGNQPFFTYPRILGHELGGEIIAVGKNAPEYSLRIGDRVAIEPYINCGTCQACRKGKTNCCENIQVLGVHADGGMVEYLEVPLRKLHKSDSLTFDQLALVETLGIGFHAVERSCIKPKEKVMVIGAGPIGIASAQFAKNKGAHVLISDFTESRMEFVLQNNWGDWSLQAKDNLNEETIRDVLDGDLPDVIIDATGNKTSMMNTFNIISAGGRITYVGLVLEDIYFNDPKFHKKEITLSASRNCLSQDFRTIINLKEKGIIDSSEWITHRSSFLNIQNDFEKFLDPHSNVVKAVIEM